MKITQKTLAAQLIFDLKTQAKSCSSIDYRLSISVFFRVNLDFIIHIYIKR